MTTTTENSSHSKSQLNNRELFGKLLICQMVIDDELDYPTIKFFSKVYDQLSANGKLTSTQMAECAGYTERWAAIYREILTKYGYLTRINYRYWKVNDKALKERTLKLLFRNLLNGR